MKRFAIHKLVLFLALLVSARIFKTGQFAFLFLFWNLFLAWLPYWFIRRYRDTMPNWQKTGIIGLTVLFLPNAPYLLTDLFHLRRNQPAPMWFDLLLIFGFSLLGLLFFLLTVKTLFNCLNRWFVSDRLLVLCRPAVFFSTGYGIYLGRYLRFNSWDIVYKPEDLVRRIFYSVADPGSTKETLAVTFTFGVFLYLIFGIFETLDRGQVKEQHELF